MNRVGLIYLLAILLILGLMHLNNKAYKRDFYIKDHENNTYFFVYIGDQLVDVKPVSKEEAEPYIINPK